MTVASAPGKIILFGEHAVVYGRPAIAVPIPQVVATAEITDIRGAAPNEVWLEAPDIHYQGWLHEVPPGHPLAYLTRITLDELALTNFAALRLRVSSTIPLASGLGSGTAVSIAVVRALGKHFGRPLASDRQSALAYEVERIHHGTPSGIDNTVVAFEQTVYYIRDQPVETFEIPVPFQIIIADSGQPSSTSVAVARVREAWRQDPDRFEALFDAIGCVAENARFAIEAGRIQDLGPLMDHNQALLDAIGVCTPSLQDLLEAAHASGALGAKISGAGLGGNVIAMVEPGTAEDVDKALRQAGAVRTIRTEIGR